MRNLIDLRRLIIATSILLIMSPGLHAFALEDEWQRALSPVEVSHRAALRDLLSRAIEYQQTQQWEKFYDLLSTSYRDGKSRDDYVSERRSLAASGKIIFLLDFIPRHTYVNDPEDPFDGKYSFYGCANVIREGRTELSNTIFSVILENGEWRVSQIGVFLTCMPTELDCKH